MELFGIVLSLPVAFVASLMYCLILANVRARFHTASRWLWWVSIGVLVWFGIEVALLVTMGAVAARGLFGPAFYAVHVALFFLGTPALANVLMLRERAGVLGRWYAVAPLCTVFALVLILLQYGVSEALYGIDGDNGPFSQRESGFSRRTCSLAKRHPFRHLRMVHISATQPNWRLQPMAAGAIMSRRG